MTGSEVHRQMMADRYYADMTTNWMDQKIVLCQIHNRTYREPLEIHNGILVIICTASSGIHAHR